MKKLILLPFLIIYYQGFSQEKNVSKTPSVNTIELIGTWSNMLYSFEQIHRKKYEKEIGQLSDSRISIPVVDYSNNRFIKMEANGKFIDLRYPNATWSMDSDFLIIILESGQQYRGFLSKDDSTNVYKLTFNGETFIKNAGFNIYPNKK